MKLTRFPVCCLVLVVMSIHPSIAWQQHDQAKAELLYTLGQQLYNDGKYQLAADTLEKAAFAFEQQAFIPGLVKSLNLAGECNANLNQCDKALEILNRSLSIATSALKPGHPEIAQTYYYLSRATGGCARKLDEAIGLMQKSMRLKRALYGEGTEIAFDYTFLGYMFNDKGQSDSALHYLDKALTIRQRHLPPDDTETANTLYYLARVYESKSELSKALALHLRSFTIRKAKLDPLHASLSNSVQQLGIVYQKFGNFDRALEYYQRALEIRKQSLGEEHVNVAASYFTIGNLYGWMYNHHQAIHYIKQGNAILEKIYGDKSDILPTYNAYLGRMYGNIGEHEVAEASFRKALHSAEKNLRPDHPYLAITYSILGEYYADKNTSLKGTEYFKKAVAIFRKAYGPGSVREADVLIRMGNIHARNKKFAQAHKYYQMALGIYRVKMGGQNPKVAATHQAIGNAAKDQQQFTASLTAYQKAFAAVSTGFYDTLNVSSTPSIAQVDNKPLALRIAHNKGQVLRKLSIQKNNDAGILQQALDTYQFAIGLIGEMASGYTLENARIELEKESRTIYNQSMEIAYQLYTLTYNQDFIHDAFAISEKSKSAILFENIRDSRAKTLAGVPDSLIEAERDIKIELAYYKKGLHQAQKNNETNRIAVYEKNIFETQQKQEQLKKRLETRFPSYFNFKYNAIKPSLDKAQQSLPDDATAVVVFFVGDSAIYRITIKKTSLHIARLAKDDTLKLLVKNYEKSLTDASFILNSRKDADRLYTQSAYALYELLIKHSVEEPENEITKLIIVPDDFLAQFNFGTLLCKEVKSENPGYKSLDYLTKRCQIRYAYSASSMQHSTTASGSIKKIFAGFAPSYPADQYAGLDSTTHPLAYLVVRSGNLPLPGAGEEVRSISEIMKGDSWLDAEATETNFKEHAANYQILHLAMHSLLNNDAPNYSELLFSPEKDKLNDGYLNVAEIYNLKLNAALVVLSACSSGFGKIQKGEGPISIARAFRYAGCPSVVMSLWKIPDGVTSRIMTTFYQELKSGKQKAEALQAAQLKFLNESNDPLYHHPYFWAGFVVMGDNHPLPEKFPAGILYVAIILTTVLLLIILLKRKPSSPIAMRQKSRAQHHV